MITFRSEMLSAPDGAKVELATVTHEGKDFVATGAYFSSDRSKIVGDPCVTDGIYTLETWGGVTIAPLAHRGTWTNARGFGGTYAKIWAWAMVIDGVRYSGRNGGPGMLLCMRRGRKV